MKTELVYLLLTAILMPLVGDPAPNIDVPR